MRLKFFINTIVRQRKYIGDMVFALRDSDGNQFSAEKSFPDLMDEFIFGDDGIYVTGNANPKGDNPTILYIQNELEEIVQEKIDENDLSNNLHFQVGTYLMQRYMSHVDPEDRQALQKTSDKKKIQLIEQKYPEVFNDELYQTFKEYDAAANNYNYYNDIVNFILKDVIKAALVIKNGNIMAAKAMEKKLPSIIDEAESRIETAADKIANVILQSMSKTAAKLRAVAANYPLPDVYYDEDKFDDSGAYNKQSENFKHINYADLKAKEDDEYVKFPLMSSVKPLSKSQWGLIRKLMILSNRDGLIRRNVVVNFTKLTNPYIVDLQNGFCVVNYARVVQYLQWMFDNA